MAKTLLTRRSFTKLAAVVGAAAGFSAAPRQALAETSQPASATPEVKVVRSCCRACGKNECGVYVTVENGRAVKVEGDADTAFHSMGNCCSKSQSSIQAAYHPDRLYHPMKRTNPKGEADPGWVRITWDEAYATIAEKFAELEERYGGECMFFMGGTSRIWTQHAYAAWGQLVNSPNALTAWQICKGPRHMATEMQSEFAYSWMATTDRPRVFVQWGTATEISNYDESCRTTVDIATTADTYISIDPRMTNLNHEADVHMYLTPGTDGALGLSWTNVIIENDLYDHLFVKRWTDAPFLVVEGMEPSGAIEMWHKIGWVGGRTMSTRLLKESDLKEDGSPLRFMVWDELAGTDEAHPLHGNDSSGHLTYFDAETGLWEGEPDEVWDQFYDNPQPNLPKQTVPGRVAVPSPFNPEIDPVLYGEFEVTLADGTVHAMRPVWDHYAEYCQNFAPEKAAEITGVPAEQIEQAARTYATRIDPSTGYGNGGIQYGLAPEHACNAIQNNRIFDTLVGITGNWDTPAGNRGPTAGLFHGLDDAQPTIVSGRHSTNDYQKWHDKILGCDRIPTLSWWQQWADCNAVHDAILTGDPYPVRGALCEASGFMNHGNSTKYWEALTKLDFFVVQDLWKTPAAGAADLLLPACHWLEIDCPRMSQGSTGAQGATCKAIEPPADCRFDVQIVVDVYEAMGRPYAENPEEYGVKSQYPDWKEQFERVISPTIEAGICTDWDDYVQKFQEHGWWDCREIAPETWGTYRRYETGMCQGLKPPTPAGNPMKGMSTPTGKMEIWSTVMETYEPDGRFNLPTWEPAPRTELADPSVAKEWPFLMTTGRRIPVYFHSEHRQLPWCRELWPAPRVEINPADAAQLGIEQGDWVWIESPDGKIRQTADLYYGIQPGVINCEHQWWFPELNQADGGFGLSTINCLVHPEHQDPICGASNLRAYNVKVYKATPENCPDGQVVPCGVDGTPIICDASDPRLKEWLPDYEIREEA
ncbi:MAG TPA: molybdopterin-dependent oxidoreductase [Candidatus Rubneribacter avistercoris]|nr:molybdopterin-dependent oxidoreductase [Candidatus Rubneribacter avistercoris]